MKKIEEQLESIEEVLSLMIRKNASIESLIQTATESQNKILADMLTEFKMDLKHHSSSQQLESHLLEIKQAVKCASNVSKVHHHFDLRSKSFVISGAMMLITTSISIAVAISNYMESRRLQESNFKFRITRQLSPVLTAKVDSIYYKDPARAQLETQRREAHEIRVREAEELLKQRQIEEKKARELLKKLKGK
jgi:hypothetical protein